MKVRSAAPLLAQDWRGDPIRTVNADVAAAELDPNSEESRALFQKRGLRPQPAATPGANRAPKALAEFFTERIAAERLANDPDARAAAELLRRRDRALKPQEQQRRQRERVRRVKRYARFA